MKGIIIYKSKYGATRQYADWLGSSLRLPVVMSDNIEGENLEEREYIVMGSPVYIGKLQMYDWLRRNEQYIKNKRIFLFVVCGSTVEDKDAQVAIIKRNIPETIRDQFRVYFLRGRKIWGDLSWKDRLLLKVAAFFANAANKKNLLEDFDDVKSENIIPLVNDVSRFLGRNTQPEAGKPHSLQVYKAIPTSENN